MEYVFCFKFSGMKSKVEEYYDDLESVTVILEFKDGAYEPISPEDILSMYI